MQTLKSIVFTFCLASLSAGVLLHLFPDAAAKRCMKAVAGLYIMSALLGVISGSSAFYDEVSTMVSQLESDSASSITAEDSTDFVDSILSQSEASLSAQYTAALTAQGYEVSAAITLVQMGDDAMVQGVSVTSTAALTQEQQAEISDYFAQAIGVSEVAFLSEEEGVT